MLSGFRELTSCEMEFVSGGVSSGEEIIVVGERFYEPYDDGTARNDSGYDPSVGDQSGTAGLTPENTPGVQIMSHTSHCGSASGAAVQAAKHMMGTGGFSELSATDGSTYNGSTAGASLAGIEFSAVIVDNGNGTYGTQHGQIWTEDKTGASFVPAGFYGNTVGIWHNHPNRGVTDASDAYPSPDDWDQLDAVHSSWAAEKGASWDPSLWVTGPDGVTREFKYSQESYFRHLSLPDQSNGVGLAGTERTSSCGAN